MRLNIHAPCDRAGYFVRRADADLPPADRAANIAAGPRRAREIAMPSRHLLAALLLSVAACSDDSESPYEAAARQCVDTINMYRATLGLPAYARWTEAEGCSDDAAASDGKTGQPHGAFTQCDESAQNECPGWPAPAESMIDGCLELMWNEGPGADFSAHGHYINMSSTAYTRVACGFAEVDGAIWAVQNFQ